MTVVEMPQHMVALGKANHVRTTRAALRREVRRGELDIRELVKDPPAVMLSVTVYDLLQWLPRVGETRAKRLLHGICGLTVPLGNTGAFTRGRVCEAVTNGFYLQQRRR